MAVLDLEGPGWALRQLDDRAGRFPLAVEAHLLNMTARLVPGATTVTTKARYYALHGLVALEADRRGLDADAARALLRRCEVVVAATSAVYPDVTTGAAHGHDRIEPRLRADGELDVAGLATPRTGYANSGWGFLGPYVGSEMSLRILAGADLTPGDRVAVEPLTESFAGLFDLAAQDTVALDELAACPHLALGAGRAAADGVWLARLFCAVGLDDPIKLDEVRRGTVRLLARAAAIAPEPSITRAFRMLVAYGPAARTDRVASTIPHADAWRGTVFRHDSVGAWRSLWAWLVDQIHGNTRPSELVEAAVASLPGGTLGDLAASLPATRDDAGDPVPAEEQVRAEGPSTPEECLSLLILGARRTNELEGRARDALVGQGRPAVLSPLWVKHWVEERAARPMADVGAELVTTLLDRSRRVALGKMRIDANGAVWLPTRVHERGDFLYSVGRESGANVGLRINQLANILGGVGVLDWAQNRWQVSAFGDELLDVVAP